MTGATDGMIANLQEQLREAQRERERFGMIAQTEICRLENKVAALERDKADLLIMVETLKAPVIESPA